MFAGTKKSMILNGRYFIDDPESGFYEVDKETYESHQRQKDEWYEKFIRPNIDPSKKRVGMISICTTSADDCNGSEDFKKLWQVKF